MTVIRRRRKVSPNVAGVEVKLGDCVDVLKGMADASVDSIVTDPPYGLSNTTPDQVSECLQKWTSGERDYVPHARGGFMSHAWDSFVPPPAVWDECFRVLKPGGHLLSFAGSRTQDLMGMSIRLAGFDVRENLAWVYGSGFPKSLNVSKAIDKMVGVEREVVGTKVGLPGYSLAPGVSSREEYRMAGNPQSECDITAPHSPDAKRWQGFGTALKPAHEPVLHAQKPFSVDPAQEPIICARKPLSEKTVAANVLKHGTGALNIDATRVETIDDLNGGAYAKEGNRTESASLHGGSGMNVPGKTTGKEYVPPTGRWPANVVFSHNPDCEQTCSEGCPVAELDEQTGVLKSGAISEHHQRSTVGGNGVTHGAMHGVTGAPRDSNSGGGSRFFPVFKYQAKAPKSERPKVDGVAHSTVKPLSLMRWLVRLVTPPGGLCLDPFAGSGTTVEACMLEGFRCIGIERNEEYIPLIRVRIERASGRH